MCVLLQCSRQSSLLEGGVRGERAGEKREGRRGKRMGGEERGGAEMKELGGLSGEA